MSHNKVSRIEALDEFAAILFPGNLNHQRIFVAIYVELKWSKEQLMPALDPVVEQYGLSKRVLQIVRAKMRRLGIIDHISRFNKKYGYREGWVLSNRFSKMLNELGVEVIASANSIAGFQALEYNESEIDMYFFDIELADGNVFELLDKKSLNKPIVFTTAYNQYALEAFKQFSIDYLLKPFSKKDVVQALEKYKKHYSSDFKSQLNLLTQHLRPTNYKQRLLIKIGDKLKTIPIDLIKLIWRKLFSDVSYSIFNGIRTIVLGKHKIHLIFTVQQFNLFNRNGL
jgi:CheY-like chemotaxis protein